MSVATQEAALRLAKDGITPLEVMIQAMRKVYGGKDGKGRNAVEAFKLACDCAPYMHARIASLELKKDGEDPFSGSTNAEIRIITQAAIAKLREINVSPKLELPAPDAKR